MIFLRFLIRNGKERERCRSFMRVPNSFHGSDLGGLVARDEVARFVAHMERKRCSDETECSRKTERGSGELHILALEHVISGNRHHEEGAGHVTTPNRVNKFRLCPFTREDCPEIGHLHAHRFEVKFSSDRIHHPAVGHQNPERGEV